MFEFLFLAAYAARDSFAPKSHSTTTQYRQLRRLALALSLFSMLMLTLKLVGRKTQLCGCTFSLLTSAGGRAIYRRNVRGA